MDAGRPEQAIAFLPGFIIRFNRTLARPARVARAAWRSASRDLDRILACRYLRVIAPDHTVPLAGEALHVPPGPGGRSYARCRVEVRELLDGRVLVLYHGRVVGARPASAPPFTLVPRTSSRARYHSAEPPASRPKTLQPQPVRPSRAHNARIKPAANHVWRRGYDKVPLRRREDRAGVS